jgi:hypothetical protein
MAIYNGDKGSLAVRSFPKETLKLSVETGRIPYHIFSARTPATTPAQPVYLDFKTVVPVNETQFLTAIVPAKTESVARSLIKQMTELKGENMKGIRVDRGNKKDLVMFRIGPQTIRYGEWSADAATVTITQNANALELFAVQNARSLRRGNQLLFSSESPVSVAVRLVDNVAEATVNSGTTTRITLFTTSLSVPAGQHVFKVPLR